LNLFNLFMINKKETPMKITKSDLTKIIKEEIFELLLMEAKVKVSYEDIESVKALYPNEQDEKALEDLWKKYEKAKEDQKARAKTKALIVWLKTNYISKKRTDHPPHEALPVVERFIGKMNSVKQKYKDNPEFKEKVNKLTKGKPPQINLFSAINMEGLEDALEKKVGDIEGNKELAQGDKIGETQNWEVFMPTRVDSSCELGKGTTWCTARTRGDNLFYNYISRSIVLFYVIKKNAGTPPDEHPNDYLSLGYKEDGSKIEVYSDGQTNINSDNKGIDPEQFEAIVGAEESKEVYQIIEKIFQNFEEHPAKELLRKAGQDLNTFHSMFTRGQSFQVTFDIIAEIRRLAKKEKGLSTEVEKAINDKMIKVIKKDNLKEKLKWTWFRNVDFRGVELKGIDFSGRKLDHPNFEGVNLEGINFSRSQLSYANFKGAKLQKVKFNFCSLPDADFEAADLREVDFEEADLSIAKFVRAKLQGAKLQGAKLYRSNLSEADFSGADLERASAPLANFEKCNLEKCNLRKAFLLEAKLKGANLKGGYLGSANLEKCNLEKCNLEGAYLNKANLWQADLRGANLEGASLKGAYLVGVNLEGVNLKGAKYNSETTFPVGFEEKFTKSKLFKMIKEEILKEMNDW